jgi:hypothetical protein
MHYTQLGSYNRKLSTWKIAQPLNAVNRRINGVNDATLSLELIHLHKLTIRDMKDTSRF